MIQVYAQCKFQGVPVVHTHVAALDEVQKTCVAYQNAVRKCEVD